MSKLTGIKITDGKVTAGSEGESGLINTVMDSVMLPVKAITGSKDEYIGVQQAGITTIVGTLGGFVFGQKSGFDRANAGQNILWPMKH